MEIPPCVTADIAILKCTSINKTFLSKYETDDDNEIQESDDYDLQTLPEQFYSSMRDVSKQLVQRHTVQYD